MVHNEEIIRKELNQKQYPLGICFFFYDKRQLQKQIISLKI